MECAGPSKRSVPTVSLALLPTTSLSRSFWRGRFGCVDAPAVAMPESDLEVTAMLSRATERVGLEWRKPPCPEPSRLDDWFLGVACAGSQHPAPGASLPRQEAVVSVSGSQEDLESHGRINFGPHSSSLSPAGSSGRFESVIKGYSCTLCQIMEAGKRAPHTQTPPRSATGQVPAFHLAALLRVRRWS